VLSARSQGYQGKSHDRAADRVSPANAENRRHGIAV
jgi:hypothetical protein